MKVIKTVSGDEVQVDDAFFDVLSTKRWYSLRGPGRTSYARCYHKGEHLYMHRLVMEEPDGLVIDHLDGNGLNNQRANLEAVTLAENTRRIGMRKRAARAYDRFQALKVYADE